jgi:hypothetical protein
VAIKAGQGSVVLIDLVATGVELKELVVHKGKEKYSKKNNPAVEMIKKLRARRDDNDPRRFTHYGYTQYEKMSIGFADLDEIVNRSEDQQWIEQYADTSLLTGKRILPISIKETVARDYFGRNPDQHKQLVLGTKNAGLDEQIDQSSIKKVLDDFMGEIDIFQNDVTLLTNRFVSPLSRIAVDFYKFYLNDTVVLDGERCAVLSFVPFTPQTFGFLGRLYVSLEDTTMFIKRVTMGVPHDINLNYVDRMSIQQDFDRASNGSRIKVRDDVEICFKLISGIPDYRVYLDHKAISDNGIDMEKLKTVIIDYLRSLPHMQYVFDIEKAATTPMPPLIRDRALLGYNPHRGGDIIFIPEPNHYNFGNGSSAVGTTHGEWNPYDAHIPAVFFGWKIEHGSTSAKTYMTDIAPTVCELLHIQMPNACIGNAITEIVDD